MRELLIILIVRLTQILEKLKAVNWRMLRILIKLRKDIKLVLQSINDAISKDKFLQGEEKKLEKLGENLKSASKNAESDFNNISNMPPETIVISITSEAGSIFEVNSL